jgi:hypothetical protein
LLINPISILSKKTLNDKYNKKETSSMEMDSDESEDENKEKRIKKYMSNFFIDVDELEEVHNDINYESLA